MLADKDLASLMVGAYEYDNKPFPWDKYWADLSGVHFGVKQVGNYFVIIFTGSENFSDWMKDFTTWPETSVKHPKLGYVHKGFDNGLDDVEKVLLPLIRNKNIVIIGHSLGAARALLYAARLIVDGRIPARLVAFAPPRPGFKQLESILLPVDATCYCNRDNKGYDIVTTVPFHWPYIAPYVQPIGLTYNNISPNCNDIKWNDLDPYHHMPLYAKALN